MQAVMHAIARMREPGPCPDCRLDPPPREPGAMSPTFCPRVDTEQTKAEENARKGKE